MTYPGLTHQILTLNPLTKQVFHRDLCLNDETDNADVLNFSYICTCNKKMKSTFLSI